MKKYTGNEEITFMGRSGGTATMPRSKVDNQVGMQNLVNSGRTTGEQQALDEEQRRRNFMEDKRRSVGQRALNMNMYERQARSEVGGMQRAQQNQQAGTLSMDDALALGLRRSRYGDFGEVQEQRTDQRMIQGPYGRQATDDQTRMVSRDRTPEEWLEAMFNGPQRQKNEAETAQRNATLQSAFGNPNLQPTTKLFGPDGKVNKDLNFMQKPEADKFMNTGAGVFNSTKQEMVPGTARPVEQEAAPIYPYRAGMNAEMMLPGGVPGRLDVEKGVYKPYGVTYRVEQQMNPETKQIEDVYVSSANVNGLESYEGWGQNAGAELAPADRQALEWAQQNANDPRAIKIMERLGVN